MRAPATALVMHPVVRDELLRPDHIKRIERACFLISVDPFRQFIEMGEVIAQVEILITSWGAPRIDHTALSAFPKLKLIAHLAGSVKGFIDESAWNRGVRVTNAVAANAVPVAQYTLAAILFANKRVFQLNRFYTEYRENRAPWTKEAPNVGNYEKTIGVVGASHVGRALLELLQPFDFKILLYDPYLSPLSAREIGATKVGLSELLSQSDVISLHVPLLPETRHMIDSRELALMKDGATIINTARGGIVNQDALISELSTDRIFAVLDTTTPDALESHSALFEMKNVFLTPHIAGSLGRETERLTDLVIDEIERFTQNQPMQHEVKREDLSRLA